MPSNGHRSVLARREFLFGAPAALGSLAAAPAQALSIFRKSPDLADGENRNLYMLNQRTGEIFNEIYFDGEDYLPEALDRFAHFARDLRANQVGEMDPRLLDLAADIQELAGIDEPLILTHGFRSPSTRFRRGAANSMHLHGKALDMAHPRLRASDLHRHAAALDRGGLGRYPSFIHIDTGPTRRW